MKKPILNRKRSGFERDSIIWFSEQAWIIAEIGCDLKANRGIKALMKIYRNISRIPENRNHYSEKDYRNAERKFLKYSLEQRKIEMEEEPLGEWYLRLLQKI